MSTVNEQVKYPRTPHLPFSESVYDDDKIIAPDALTALRQVEDFVVTEKMDGGNLTWTRNHFFGRSLDSGTHHWDQRARAMWAEQRFNIPEGWRISGESLYARRSVSYDELPGYYMIFGIWNEENTLLSWEDTEEWATLMGIPTVPVLYRGGDWGKCLSAWEENGLHSDISEGFVIRNAGSFSYDEFTRNVAKYVRSNHVRTRADWRHRDDYNVNALVSEVAL